MEISGLLSCLLELMGHFLDRSRELEWQLIGEIHDGTEVFADVETLANRDPEWDCFLIRPSATSARASESFTRETRGKSTETNQTG
jgi:hypothetical protein